jgi:hypothetical protein
VPFKEVIFERRCRVLVATVPLHFPHFAQDALDGYGRVSTEVEEREGEPGFLLLYCCCCWAIWRRNKAEISREKDFRFSVKSR